MEDIHANQRDDAERMDHPPELRAANRAELEQLLSQQRDESISSLELDHGQQIILTTDSITSINADAVVNAANEMLEGGGGVDQAIHAVAGPQLRDRCAEIPFVTVSRVGGAIHQGEQARCPVGEARSTPAFNLPHAKYIIHTVAPLLDDDGKPREELLQRCYSECLEAASESGCESIAFCALGTGFYGFPQVLGAQIAVCTAHQWLLESHSRATSLSKVIFCMYGSNAIQVYPVVLGNLRQTMQ